MRWRAGHRVLDRRNGEECLIVSDMGGGDFTIEGPSGRRGVNRRFLEHLGPAPEAERNSGEDSDSDLPESGSDAGSPDSDDPDGADSSPTPDEPTASSGDSESPALSQ